MAKAKILERHLEKMKGLQVYKGFNEDQMLEIHVDIPAEEERKARLQAKLNGEPFLEPEMEVKQSKVNERSSLLKLESLEQIRRRDPP